MPAQIPTSQIGLSDLPFQPRRDDSVAIAGPVNGRELKRDDVKTAPTALTSNPTLKKVRTATIAFASGAVGVQKLLLSGKAIDPANLWRIPALRHKRPRAKRPPSSQRSIILDVRFGSKADLS